jgi:L-fuconolactonase
MRIDSHVHFWNFDPRRDEWITEDMSVLRRDFGPAEIAGSLSVFGIDGVVAVQADQSEQETHFLATLAEKHPVIKGVVGWVDLKGPDLREKLIDFRRLDVVKGFRHVVQAERPGFLTDPHFAAGVRVLGELGYTYDLLITHDQLDEALKFVHTVPDVRMVIDHIAKPSIRTGEKTHWELSMAAMSTFPNVFCKLSGMVTEAKWKRWTRDDFYPFIDEVMESFGPSRIMYGSDWPVCLLSASYAEQLNIVDTYIASLSENERTMIMGGNATAFYGLK